MPWLHSIRLQVQPQSWRTVCCVLRARSRLVVAEEKTELLSREVAREEQTLVSCK